MLLSGILHANPEATTPDSSAPAPEAGSGAPAPAIVKPAAAPATLPATTKPVPSPKPAAPVAKPAQVKVKPAADTAVTPKPAPQTVGTPPVATSPAKPMAVPPILSQGNIVLQAELDPVERARQSLLANAEKLNVANQALLSRNQSLLMQNENLALQLKVLQNDQSSEGIRNGALAALGGVILGWLLAGIRRPRNDSW